MSDKIRFGSLDPAPSSYRITTPPVSDYSERADWRRRLHGITRVHRLGGPAGCVTYCEAHTIGRARAWLADRLFPPGFSSPGPTLVTMTRNESLRNRAKALGLDTITVLENSDGSQPEGDEWPADAVVRVELVAVWAAHTAHPESPDQIEEAMDDALECCVLEVEAHRPAV